MGAPGFRKRSKYLRARAVSRLWKVCGGYAGLLVFLVHHHTLFGGYLPPAGLVFKTSAFLHTIGNSGVDLFFVLSGYLVYGQIIRKPLSYWTFLRRRVARIYPAFLAVFVVYLCLAAS